METMPLLRVLSDRLDEPGIELRTPGYVASGLSTTPWRPLIAWLDRLVYGISSKLSNIWAINSLVINKCSDTQCIYDQKMLYHHTG